MRGRAIETINYKNSTRKGMCHANLRNLSIDDKITKDLANSGDSWPEKGLFFLDYQNEFKTANLACMKEGHTADE